TSAMAIIGTKRRRFVTIGTVLALSALTACGGGNDNKSGGGTAEETPIQGGTLIGAIPSSSGLLNPAVTTSGGVHTNSELMFNGLLAYDKNDQIVGDLAEKFTLSADGKTADFT